jgi:hypothetical protein
LSARRRRAVKPRIGWWREGVWDVHSLGAGQLDRVGDQLVAGQLESEMPQ